MSNRTQIDALVNWLLDHGIPVCKTRNGHWRADILDQGPVFLPGTPSDHRSVKNARAMVRRKLRAAGWAGEMP